MNENKTNINWLIPIYSTLQETLINKGIVRF